MSSSAALISGCAGPVAAGNSGRWWLYVGTYTGPRSQGIQVASFDAATGRVSTPALAAAVKNPSFLAVHPSHPWLYSVNEMDQWSGKPGGGLTAFSVDRSTGALTRRNEVSSGGAGPCHLTVDRSGRCVLVANYSGGSVASVRLNADGSLGAMGSFIQHAGSSVNAQRQEGPHGHSINVSPDNRFAFAADLGLDRVFSYRLDPAAGTLAPNQPAYATVAPGSGPRHFAFHPSGKYAYVINEMLCTVTAFAYDASRGALQTLHTVSTLPASDPLRPEFSTAEIVAHPGGRFVYGSNRGHDTIAVFAVASDGRLSLVENVSTQGKTPRNFALDPTGRFLLAANQSSDSIVVFQVDPTTGRLTPTGQTVAVGAPVCLRFVPAA